MSESNIRDTQGRNAHGHHSYTVFPCRLADETGKAVTMFVVPRGPKRCVSFTPVPGYVRRADKNTDTVQLGFPVATRVYRMFNILVKMSVGRDFRTRNMSVSNIRDAQLERM